MINCPWYIPSFYGDIRLEADGKTTRVIYAKLTLREKAALEAVRAKYDLGALPASPFTISAKLTAVQKVIVKALKPDRALLSAVRFADGTMQEISEGAFVDVVEGSGKGRASTPVAAVTVAQPARGCPEPEFAKAEIRAREVLDVFLTPQQRTDFRARQQFVSVGADTGHTYMITSRHALGGRFPRSLHDLVDDRPVCTHDYMVPAAEEVLALHLFVSLPRWETFVRALPA